MARREKREKAIKKRESLKKERKSAKGKEKAKLTRQILTQGKIARRHGEALRKESGRERGEATRYIGPTGGALTWADARAVQARKDRELPTPTIYQDVNRARMALEKGKTTAQKRAAFKALWGDPGSDKYKEMQGWQAKEIAAGRYNKNLSLLDNLEDLLDLDDGKTRVSKTTVGSEYLTTPYTRPALQDWSNIMPEEGLLRSQAQRAIVADKGANFQPWAQGGLIEYSPAGTATYVPRTYTPSGSTGTTGAAGTAGATTTTVPQVYTLRDGTKTTDFMKFTQDNAERYYPGRFEAAQDAGVSGWRAFTPEGREWTAAQPNTSAAWIAAQRAANDAGNRQVASNAVFNAGRGLLNPTPAGTDLATLIALEGR